MRFHALAPFPSLESKWAWLDYKQCQNGLEVGITLHDTLFLETKRFKYEVFISYFSGFNRVAAKSFSKVALAYRIEPVAHRKSVFPARPSGCLRGKTEREASSPAFTAVFNKTHLLRRNRSEARSRSRAAPKNLSSRTMRVRIGLPPNKMARHAGKSSLGK